MAQASQGVTRSQLTPSVQAADLFVIFLFRRGTLAIAALGMEVRTTVAVRAGRARLQSAKAPGRRLAVTGGPILAGACDALNELVAELREAEVKLRGDDA